ncbi:MAG: GcrA family cell cycle regulator [Salinarimonas sp.]
MTDASVTWNDERVEQLKKLWAEGKSASQIAAEIGGVSRNAVIGKVHRLGLSGRPKAGGSAKPRKGGADAAKAGGAVEQRGAPRVGGAQAQPQAASTAAGESARDAAGAEVSAARPAGLDGVASRSGAGSAAEAVIDHPASARSAGHGRSMTDGLDAGSDSKGTPPGLSQAGVTGIVFPERVTIMDLREGMCRWPIGDPTSPDFHFCGARSEIGSPYCEHHAQIAYQPADRRREKKVARG